jgi:hypothetical protein
MSENLVTMKMERDALADLVDLMEAALAPFVAEDAPAEEAEVSGRFWRTVAISKRQHDGACAVLAAAKKARGGTLRTKDELRAAGIISTEERIETLERELSAARAALDSVSGALVDAGCVPVPDDESKYGEAVRQLAFNAATAEEWRALRKELAEAKAELATCDREHIVGGAGWQQWRDRCAKAEARAEVLVEALLDVRGECSLRMKAFIDRVLSEKTP